MDSTVFVAPNIARGIRVTKNGFFCVRKQVAVHSVAKAPAVTMGLNAKNMMKNKKKKGKGGKSGSKGSGGANPARSGNVQVDTNRREYIYQMRNVNKTLDNGKQILKNINLAYFPGGKFSNNYYIRAKLSIYIL